MIARRDEELLHRELDGEIGDAESAALAARLAAEPELRARRDALLRLARILREAGEVDPPGDLAEGVLRGLRGAPAPAAAPGGGWRETLRRALGGGPDARHVLLLASGLAAGALLVALVRPSHRLPTIGSTDLVATMLPAGALGPLEDVDDARFDLADVQGEATTSRGPGVVVTEIRIESPGPADLSVEFDGEAFTPLAFSRDGTEPVDVSLDRHGLRLTRAGKGRYVLVLGVDDEDSPSLRLTMGGEGRRMERTLETRRKGSSLPGS